MAELNTTTDPSPLPSKRTLDSVQNEEDNNPKKPKIRSFDHNSNNNLVVEDPDEIQENPIEDNADSDPKALEGEKEEVGKCENEEKSANGKGLTTIDRKGKGILIEEEEDSEDDEEESANGKGVVVVDRKGKGILIEEDEDSDDEGDDDDDDDDDDDSNDDDDDDDGVELSDGDVELSDDPLAEVDLDNILPSRTRRRVVDPGAYDASLLAGIDSDSDDSDA